MPERTGKVAVHRERLFEDYVCRIIDAEQYETFSKQDAETEKEIQNNMEILLKHQVGYEKFSHRGRMGNIDQ